MRWLTAIVLGMTTSTIVMAQGASSPAGQPDASAVQCGQAQAAVGVAIEAALGRLEAARQANSVAAMRASNDAVQASLLDIRARLAPCAALAGAGGGEMPGMPNMPGMSGMRGMPGMPGMRRAPDGTWTPGDAAVPGADPHAGHVMPPAEGTAPPASGATHVH
jgi:hypothetical protein